MSIQTVNLLISLLSVFLLSSCAGQIKDIAIIDELKHPTKYPDIYRPAVLSMEKLLAENPLEEGDNLRVVPLGETKYSSLQMMLIRQGVEIPTHYHKNHDEIVHIKKGSGILIMDGTHYYLQPGMVVIIPRKSRHKFINTGEETHVALSVFYPPYAGDDIKFVKEKKKRVKKKTEKEREKEEEKKHEH